MTYDMTWVDNNHDEDSWFGVTVMDMQSLIEEMHRRGMLDRDYDLSGSTIDAVHLRWHPYPVQGIAEHKFGSMDGWIVTPSEIRAALRANDRHPVSAAGRLSQLDRPALVPCAQVLCHLTGAEVEPVDDGLWQEWVAWLRKAVSSGGFRVS